MLFNPITRYREIARLGLLGINRRNIHYIGRYNRRQLFPNVDDKLKTKRLAAAHKVTTPKLIGVIETQHDIQSLRKMVQGLPGFAVKPSKGSGGKGILLLRLGEDGKFEKLNGTPVAENLVETHASNILSGLYSLGGKPDVAFIETLIEPDPIFANFSYQGVPDIRVVVFQGFTVMAMIRLPTSESNGKANLHQGALGVGINIATGKASGAVQFDQSISHHPDTGFALSDIHVPDWNTLLKLAASCHPMSGLGYLGVDIVLDRTLGPMLLELNARPGLSIQTANNCGLLPRLRAVEALPNAAKMGVHEKLVFSQQTFS